MKTKYNYPFGDEKICGVLKSYISWWDVMALSWDLKIISNDLWERIEELFNKWNDIPVWSKVIIWEDTVARFPENPIVKIFLKNKENAKAKQEIVTDRINISWIRDTVDSIARLINTVWGYNDNKKELFLDLLTPFYKNWFLAKVSDQERLIMTYISSNKSGVKISEIADKSNIKSTSISSILSRLMNAWIVVKSEEWLYNIDEEKYPLYYDWYKFRYANKRSS